MIVMVTGSSQAEDVVVLRVRVREVDIGGVVPPLPARRLLRSPVVERADSGRSTEQPYSFHIVEGFV